uniref:Uncharacterized protein n=2 Tax=Clytia hemisphaerica TaxID=252671 RepID=A0A7M5WLA4_9CNID
MPVLEFTFDASGNVSKIEEKGPPNPPTTLGNAMIDDEKQSVDKKEDSKVQQNDPIIKESTHSQLPNGNETRNPNVSKLEDQKHQDIPEVSSMNEPQYSPITKAVEPLDQDISNNSRTDSINITNGDKNTKSNTSNWETGQHVNQHINKKTDISEIETSLKPEKNRPPNLLTVGNQTPSHYNSSGGSSPVSPLSGYSPSKSPSVIGSFGLIEHVENVESEDEEYRTKKIKIKNETKNSNSETKELDETSHKSHLISHISTNSHTADYSHPSSSAEYSDSKVSTAIDSINKPNQEIKTKSNEQDLSNQDQSPTEAKLDISTKPSQKTALWSVPQEISKKSQRNFAEKAEHHSNIRAVHHTKSNEIPQPKPMKSSNEKPPLTKSTTIKDTENHTNSKGLRPPPVTPKPSKESLSRPDTPELLDDNGDPLYAPVVKNKKSASRESSSDRPPVPLPYSGWKGAADLQLGATASQEGKADVFVQSSDLLDENGNPLYEPVISTKKTISRGASVLSDSGISSEPSPDAFKEEPIYALPEVSPQRQRKFKPSKPAPYQHSNNHTTSSNGFSMSVTEDPYSSINDGLKPNGGDPDDLLSSINDSLKPKNISVYKSNLTLDEADNDEGAMEDTYASIDQNDSKIESTINIKPKKTVEDPYSLVKDDLQKQNFEEPYATLDNKITQQVEDPYATVPDNIKISSKDRKGPYSMAKSKEDTDVEKTIKDIDDPYATIQEGELNTEDDGSDYENVEEFENGKESKSSNTIEEEPIYSNIQESRDRSKTVQPPSSLHLKQPTTRSYSSGSLSPQAGSVSPSSGRWSPASSGRVPVTPTHDSPSTRRSPLPSPMSNRPPMPTPESPRRETAYTPVITTTSSITNKGDLDNVDGPLPKNANQKDIPDATPYKYVPRPSSRAQDHQHSPDEEHSPIGEEIRHPSPTGENNHYKGRMFTYAQRPVEQGVILDVQSSPTKGVDGVEVEKSSSPVQITIEKSDYRDIIPENSKECEVQIEKLAPEDVEYQPRDSHFKAEENKKLSRFFKKSNSPHVRRPEHVTHSPRHDRHTKARSEMFIDQSHYPEQPVMPRGGWFQNGNTEIRNSWTPEGASFSNNNGQSSGRYPVNGSYRKNGYNRYSAVEPYQYRDGYKESPLRDRRAMQPDNGKKKLRRTRSDHTETSETKKKEHTSNKFIGFFRAAKKTIRRSRTTDPSRGAEHYSQKRQDVYEKEIAEI